MEFVVGDTTLSARKDTRAYRAKAIAAFANTGCSGNSPQTKGMVQICCEQAADDWCRDPDAASEINADCSEAGFDLATISAHVFLQARESSVGLMRCCTPPKAGVSR
jgi:hypothetical protein